MSGQLISDVLYLFALFFNAALFIPQAYKIFKNKDASGASLITFFGFNIIQGLGVINGFYHQDYALAIGQIASFITCGFVTIQIIILKRKKNLEMCIKR